MLYRTDAYLGRLSRIGIEVHISIQRLDPGRPQVVSVPRQPADMELGCL